MDMNIANKLPFLERCFICQTGSKLCPNCRRVFLSKGPSTSSPVSKRQEISLMWLWNLLVCKCACQAPPFGKHWDSDILFCFTSNDSAFFFFLPATAQACAGVSVMNCFFNFRLKGLVAEQQRLHFEETDRPNLSAMAS